MCIGYEQSASSAAAALRRLPLNLFYCGKKPVNLQGAITGNLYQFSQLQPVQPVDPKDAVFLLASQLFRLAL